MSGPITACADSAGSHFYDLLPNIHVALCNDIRYAPCSIDTGGAYLDDCLKNPTYEGNDMTKGSDSDITHSDVPREAAPEQLGDTNNSECVEKALTDVAEGSEQLPDANLEPAK